jgi:hypothetical protein
VAAISTQAKASSSKNSVCELASPVHAVLVCGFHGFDETGSNRRPKLGARLVAFDGVSVEVGKWTFDAVRKAIQARDRPLTLSFRNDFLTTEQRTILTRAVQDVDAVTALAQTSSEKNIQSTHSRRGDARDGERYVAPEDDISESATESDYQSYFPQSFSGARSVASLSGRNYQSFGGETQSISSSTGGGNFRSFSEAGSSATSVLSAVAPLVSNLLNMKRRREPFTPEYLRRAPESVEGTPQHQDFQSELL